MAILLQNSSEGGTDGTTITTGNSGGASGDAYSAVSKGATSTLAFSAANPSHGALGIVFDNSSSETNFVQWAPAGEDSTTYAMRGYLSAAAAPAAANEYIGGIRNSSTSMASVAVTSTSKFRIFNTDSSASVLGTVTIPWGLPVFIRWELQVISGTTTSNGQFYFAWYIGESLTAQEVLSSTTFNVGILNASIARFGRSTSVANTWTFTLDSLALQTAASGFIGPVSTNYRSNNFEGGTNGATLATSDTGSGDSFGAVTIVGSGTIKYSNVTAMHGSKSFEAIGTGGADAAYARFQGASAVSAAIRFYMYAAAQPSGAIQIAGIRSASAGALAININASFKLQLVDTNGSVVFTFTNALAIGVWYRVEASVMPATTTTGCASFAYYVGDSPTPAESINVTTTANYGTAVIATASFGKLTSNTVTCDIYFDDVAFTSSAATFIGNISSGGFAAWLGA